LSRQSGLRWRLNDLLLNLALCKYPLCVIAAGDILGRDYCEEEYVIVSHSYLRIALSYAFLPFRSRKTHPGPVVHLSDSPLDASKVRRATAASKVTVNSYTSTFPHSTVMSRDVLAASSSPSDLMCVSIFLHHFISSCSRYQNVIASRNSIRTEFLS
jgi:hypothetical protein